MLPDALIRARKIKLIAFDIDGVMTDGTLYFGDDGLEYKGFNSLDGHGLKMLQGTGVELAIITGRSSRVVECRAKNLGITLVHQGAHDKLAVYESLCRELDLQCDETAFICVRENRCELHDASLRSDLAAFSRSCQGRATFIGCW